SLDRRLRRCDEAQRRIRRQGAGVRRRRREPGGRRSGAPGAGSPGHGATRGGPGRPERGIDPGSVGLEASGDLPDPLLVAYLLAHLEDPLQRTDRGAADNPVTGAHAAFPGLDDREVCRRPAAVTRGMGPVQKLTKPCELDGARRGGPLTPRLIRSWHWL